MMDHANNDGRAFSGDGAQRPDKEPGAGYCWPPEHTKFKPGETANRRGRPRGARGRKQVVRQIAGEMHVVREGGKRCRRTTLELVLFMLRNEAAKGNVQAFNLSHELQQRYLPQETIGKPRGTVIVPQIATREDWEHIIAEHRKQKGIRDPNG